MSLRRGSLGRDCRRALSVAWTNFRRQVRVTRANPYVAFAYLFSLCFGVLVAVGQAPLPGFAGWPYPGGYALGRAFAAGDPTVLSRVRGFAGILFTLLVLVTVIKEATDGQMATNVEALVLSAGPRAVAFGAVCWSVLQTATQFGPLVLAGALAFGVGAGDPAAAVGLALAGGLLVVAAVPLGYVFAAAVKLAFQRVAVVREHRLVVGAPLAVAYFGLFARARASMALLSASPAGWFGDLGLVAAGGAAALPAAGAVALAGVGSVGGTAVSVSLATRLWLGDEVRAPESGDDTAASAVSGPLLGRLVGRPAAAVTRSVWTRVVREPRSLLFVAMSAGLAGAVGVELAAQTPTALPVVVAVYGGTTAGMGATLNPLGAAGVGLPAALTTPTGGRGLVRGYALSTMLPGVPVVAFLSAFAAVLLGLPPVLVVALAVTGGLLVGTATALSLVVGLALPNVEGLGPEGSGLRPPRLVATTALVLAMATLGGPAFVGLGVGPGGGPTLPSALGGVATTAVVGVLAGAVAYRRAVRRVGTYRLD